MSQLEDSERESAKHISPQRLRKNSMKILLKQRMGNLVSLAFEVHEFMKNCADRGFLVGLGSSAGYWIGRWKDQVG